MSRRVFIMKTIINIKTEPMDSSYIPYDKELIYTNGMLIIGNGKDSIKNLLSTIILDGGTKIE